MIDIFDFIQNLMFVDLSAGLDNGMSWAWTCLSLADSTNKNLFSSCWYEIVAVKKTVEERDAGENRVGDHIVHIVLIPQLAKVSSHWSD